MINWIPEEIKVIWTDLWWKQVNIICDNTWLKVKMPSGKTKHCCFLCNDWILWKIFLSIRNVVLRLQWDHIARIAISRYCSLLPWWYSKWIYCNMIFQNQSAHTLWLIDNEQKLKSINGISDYTAVLDFILLSLCFGMTNKKYNNKHHSKL